MADPAATRPSLLLRIRNPQDSESWREFTEIYKPLVSGYCRRCGLQEADAADVTQDVLLAVAVAIRKFEYDPRRGSFRGWFHKIVRSKINNFFERRRRNPPGGGGTTMQKFFDEQPGSEEERDWDREFKEHLFHWAANKVRYEFHQSTWEAFWQTTVNNQPSKRVAEILGMKLGAVYTAKCRVLARLTERIREATGEMQI